MTGENQLFAFLNLVPVIEDAARIVYGVFSPDGQSIISASSYELMLWDVTPLLEGYESRAKTNRYVPEFTCDQRELYQIEPLCSEDTT